jgi:hypothetical protein
MNMAQCAAVVAATVALAGSAAGQQTSAEFQRRAAEMRAQHERRAAEFQSKRGANARQSLEQLKSTARPVQPFQAAAAPRPEDCWLAYVAAARRATSMEEILPYLPVARQQQLQQRQARYDPQLAAQQRERRRRENPNISERTLTFLSNPPYVNELAFQKMRAGSFLEVLSVRIDGNKAVVEISTTSGVTINGVKHPYSTATVEMIGEGSTWKVGGYDNSELVYIDPPQPKK